MYTITKGIYVDFAHHIKGHIGQCANLHGHTWYFEVTLQSKYLSDQGFVIDFKHLNKLVLAPIRLLLDHSLVLGRETFQEAAPQLEALGTLLVDAAQLTPQGNSNFYGTEGLLVGGMRLVIFSWAPTCERLAMWLYIFTQRQLATMRTSSREVSIVKASVYEQLHPVRAWAEYRGDDV